MITEKLKVGDLVTVTRNLSQTSLKFNGKTCTIFAIEMSPKDALHHYVIRIDGVNYAIWPHEVSLAAFEERDYEYV